VRPALLALAGALALGGCATKGDVQMVQGEVSLAKAEMARRDSARAAQLNDVIRLQQQVLDSLTVNRKTVAAIKGDLSTDLYNIQQQLVQLQELTGQSQQRLTELRTRLEARGAQIEGGGVAAPGDSARPTPRPPRPRRTRCTRRRWRSCAGGV
jgi:capsule polysaccharide export protein KpsE/RkpR